MPDVSSVRAATLDDLPALVEIDKLSFAEAWNEEQIRSEVTAPFAEMLLLEEPAGRLVACATFRVVEEEAELLRIAVAPDARRRGHGRRLLSVGLGRIASRGARLCHLEVSAENDAGRALYASFGFRRVGCRASYYPDGSDAELLTLEIDHS